MRTIACLAALLGLGLLAHAALPADCDVWLQVQDAVWARATPERLATVTLRLQLQGGDDCVLSLFANSNAPGGTWQSAEAGDLRLLGLGEEWIVRGQGYGNGASGRDDCDLSLNQNMVDVAEQDLLGSPQAWTTYVARAADGSGVVSLDMDEVYRHAVTEKIVTGTPPRERVAYKFTGIKDLGIFAGTPEPVPGRGAAGDSKE